MSAGRRHDGLRVRRTCHVRVLTVVIVAVTNGKQTRNTSEEPGADAAVALLYASARVVHGACGRCHINKATRACTGRAAESVTDIISHRQVSEPCVERRPGGSERAQHRPDRSHSPSVSPRHLKKAPRRPVVVFHLKSLEHAMLLSVVLHFDDALVIRHEGPVEAQMRLRSRRNGHGRHASMTPNPCPCGLAQKKRAAPAKGLSLPQSAVCVLRHDFSRVNERIAPTSHQFGVQTSGNGARKARWKMVAGMLP